MTVVDHVKLFRNRSDLRFEHRIHEQILPSIARAGGKVAWTDLFVLHSGNDHTTTSQAKKKERDLRILRRELIELPGHAFTLFNLGMTYAHTGEAARAIGYLEESLGNSASGDLHRRKAFALLAHCLLSVGNRGGALAACEAGLAECPDDLELRFRLGVVLHKLGRLRESAAAYECILAGRGHRYLTSMDVGIAGFKTRRNLAVVYAELREWEKAESGWRAVTLEAPAYRPGWRGLGELLVRLGKLDEATVLARTLEANSEMPAEGQLLSGRVAKARGRMDEMRRAWEAAAETDPTDAEPLALLAREYFESGEIGSAERVLRAQLRVAPNDASAHQNLGTVLLRTSRADEAAGTFRRALELRPESIDARMCLAYALHEIGDIRGAAEEWQSVLTRQPSHREALDALRRLGL